MTITTEYQSLRKKTKFCSNFYRLRVIVFFVFALILNLEKLNVSAFQFQLKVNQKRCFYSTIFKQQKLLLQIQTKIIKQKVQIHLQVFFKNNSIYKKVMDNLKHSYTVPRQKQSLNNQIQFQGLEYQTCVFAVNFYEESIDRKKQTDQTLFQSQKQTQTQKRYMISLKLLTNFDHILQKKVKQSSANIFKRSSSQEKSQISKNQIKQINKLTAKMKSLAKEQIEYHKTNEIIQNQISKHLKQMQDEMYSYALFQSTLIMIFTFGHITLMSKFLNQNTC